MKSLIKRRPLLVLILCVNPACTDHGKDSDPPADSGRETGDTDMGADTGETGKETGRETGETAETGSSEPLWATLSVYALNACAVTGHGLMACWGYDGGLVHPPEGHFGEVAVGLDHVCAISVSGEAVCWGVEDGYHDYGQATPPSGILHGISSGAYQTCALDEANSIICWGELSEDGPPPAGPFRSVSVGRFGACAVAMDGEVACWGFAPLPDTLPPVDADFVEVSAGWYRAHACALHADGQVQC